MRAADFCKWADLLIRGVTRQQHVCMEHHYGCLIFAVFSSPMVPLVGLPTIGDLSKWERVGKPAVVAELLKQRRDADATGGAKVESVVLPGVAVDGDVLQVGRGISTTLQMPGHHVFLCVLRHVHV